jgi:hypothetical protein
MTAIQTAFWYLGFGRFERFRKWVGGRWVKIEGEDISIYEMWEHYPKEIDTPEGAHWFILVHKGIKVLAIETWVLE